ncbi:putative inactive ATP-dependent zinc metalloprotease FTSHI 1 chloroplastic [Bienertia sinuspersici]
MCTREFIFPVRVYQPFPIKNVSRSAITSIRIRKHSNQFNASEFFRNGVTFNRRLPTFTCKSNDDTSNSNTEDFVTRVLKENPSQVEPRFRIGDEVYTSTERDNLKNKRFRFGAFEVLKRLNLKDKVRENEENGGEKLESNVYLKDILREYKGQLYVPEQMFGVNLSEEEEFDRNMKTLPKMSYEEFLKFVKKDKVKLLIHKEQIQMVDEDGFRDFIVELKETPGEKSLHRTQWAMRLGVEQAQMLLADYTGPQCEIETRMATSVGKLPDYPNSVASSISSRIMVEFGMVTIVMAAAAVIVGSFLASAVFAVTGFVFVASVYIVWPLVRPFLKLSLGIVSGIAEGVRDNFAEFVSDGGIFSKLSEIYTFGGVSASLQMLKPIMMVLLIMVLLVRFTLSRRPKNFKKWLVNYLKNPDLFDKMGIKPPHGVLLEGPPVAKAIAGEAGVPFYQMAGSEFVEVLVGVGSARIRDLFKRAKVNKPSVIFIDEIDALATRRQGIFSDSTDSLYNASTQERETTLNQLLIELDGFDTGKGVIFLGATNRMDLLDPALLRPGRFDRKIRVQPPNAKGRLDILKVHARKVKLSPSVDLSSYANDLPGWTGARLAQLLQEAALVAARKEHEEVEQSDVDDAVDRLTIGPRRVGIELGHQGQCRRAATEVGTAITSHLLRKLEFAEVERCDRVSINPRGQTLSQVVFHRLDDEHYMFERRPQLLHRLQVFLGGRAAEEVIYGRDTSIASNPMVIHGEPPPWRKTPKFVGPRLDFEGSLYDDYDLAEPPLNFNLDDEIAKRTEELLQELYTKTVAMLKQHHAALLKTVKKYPAETPVNLLLEEENPGSLPLFSEERGYELEHALATSSSGELV